jgi:hypothetical protein
MVMQGKSITRHGIHQTKMLTTLLFHALHRLASTKVLGS